MSAMTKRRSVKIIDYLITVIITTFFMSFLGYVIIDNFDEFTTLALIIRVFSIFLIMNIIFGYSPWIVEINKNFIMRSISTAIAGIILADILFNDIVFGGIFLLIFMVVRIGMRLNV